MSKVRVNWGPAPEDCVVKLFVVHNTAHNTLYVLARDNRTALSVAYTANHIYLPETKYAEAYSRAAYEVPSPDGRLLRHWSLIQEAIAKRIEGTLHVEGDYISIGYQVFGSSQ